MSPVIDDLADNRIDDGLATADDVFRALQRENDMLWRWLMILVADSPGVVAPGPRVPACDPSIYLG